MLIRIIQRHTGLERWLVVVAVILFVAAVLVHGNNDAKLKFRATAATPGSVQLYYSDEHGFSEARSQIFTVGASESRHMTMPILGTVSKGIRVDPQPGMTELQICGLVVQVGSDNLAVAPARFQASDNVRAIAGDHCTRLVVNPKDPDPQILIDTSVFLSKIEAAASSDLRIVKLLVSLGILTLLGVGCVRIWRKDGGDGGLAIPSLYRRLPLMYAVIALVVGGLYVFVTPPGGVPDEPAHLAKIVLVENGHWVGGHETAVLDPPMSNLLGPFEDFLNPSRKFTMEQVLEHSSSPLQCRPKREKFAGSASSYSPSMYAPGAVLLNIACRSGSTVGTFFYGTRLINLVLAIVFTLMGIRAAGTWGWPIAMFALLPMTLFEQASLTADSMTLGLSFLLIGLHVGLATGQIPPNRRTEAGILLVSIALAFTKPGAAWLCAGFLFSWQAYKPARSRYLRGCGLLVFLPWLLHVAWTLGTAKHGIPRGDISVEANAQMLMHEPWKVAGLVYRSFFGEGSQFLSMSLVGRLGWLDVVMQPWAYTLAYLVLAASLLMRGEAAHAIPGVYRIMVVAFGVGASLIPVLPMYLYWTSLGSGVVEGLQGRYFIPMAAFIFTWVALRVPSVRFVVFCFSAVSLLAINANALYSLLFRYYA